MTQKWYPVVDYTECIECGLCVEKCPHGVFDPDKTPIPVVIYPEECVDHCHSCGNRCPVGAITYVGDDTGWTPPNMKQDKSETTCSCVSNLSSEKRILIEYLYLDLKTCDRCIGTHTVLDEVMMALTPALKLAGYEVEYKKIEIATEELARKYQFLASPTIRVNGYDICRSVAESNCGCCGDISGTEVDCRVFEYDGETYDVPPKEMIAHSILEIIFVKGAGGCTCGEYILPENLKTFFEGKNNKNAKSCSCGGNCC